MTPNGVDRFSPPLLFPFFWRPTPTASTGGEVGEMFGVGGGRGGAGLGGP